MKQDVMILMGAVIGLTIFSWLCIFVAERLIGWALGG